MSSQLVVVDKADSIGYLRLNSPPRNEMSAAFFEALGRTVADKLQALDVKGFVVHGTGRHFSSGADVKALRAMVKPKQTDRTAQLFVDNMDIFRRIESSDKPVVAAIGGCCLGAGLELALACRYRVAARRAVFALPEATFGLMPGCGGTVRLAEIAGEAQAIELILSGRTFLADEAREIGIVDLVVDNKDLLPTAAALVRRMHQ